MCGIFTIAFLLSLLFVAFIYSKDYYTDDSVTTLSNHKDITLNFADSDGTLGYLVNENPSFHEKYYHGYFPPPEDDFTGPFENY